MTGWNLPPGCNVRDLPGNEPDMPCDVCGLFPDECICQECPTCGGQGDPACYIQHGLVRTMAQLWGKQKLLEEMAAEDAMWSRYGDEMEEEERYAAEYAQLMADEGDRMMDEARDQR